jgi:hypothetical protein
MLRRYPGTLRWRQGLPPLFVLSIILGGALAVFAPVFRLVLAVEISIYLVALLTAGIRVAVRQKTAYLVAGLPLAIATMHISWGAGFLWSMIKWIFTKRNPEKK